MKRDVAKERRRKRPRCIHKEFELNIKDEDRISELEDDILVSIISKLELKEAMATSLLSSRWRYLPTRITHLALCVFNPKLKPSEEIIDKWFDFVLAKRVEVLKIHTGLHRPFYKLSDLIGKKPLRPGLNFLKELSLSAVDLDDAEFELLLTTFPLLETLSIDSFKNLRNVKIVDNLFRLKHLSLRGLELGSLEIGNAMNLVSLKCYIRIDNLVKLYNVPKLIELATDHRGFAGNLLIQILSTSPSCILAQLRVLRVSTSILAFWPEDMHKIDLINIQHLDLTIYMYDDMVRFTNCLLPLIGAWPSLEKLDIKFLWRRSRFKFEGETHQILYDMWARNNNKSFNSKLVKKLHISGYLGCEGERQLVMCIMKNYGVQELVVEVCDYTHKMRRWATARACQHFSTPQSPLKKITII
ncbi:putative FBD-associated F-box protein At5g53640 isoform X2 [Salvia miltiorrhiza]|uniref:putative FBD-associated F-box protein At5g53640 isoform X2 n=1 Tax=Salvia miltiorrhiza TaxID=226208 RepID=UPI0025AB6A12|nr:putative FBD-associated F-box protein At5g53640 isoform X2 [Salvia miltiorrhiza]XP_057777668.1 putative FBD-associated F-box protein At5g53640 isoform X2 [Salvia miltiorrhiza]